MKPLPAIIAALGITAVVVFVMVAIGANALLNPNTVPVVNAASSNSPDAVPVAEPTIGSTADQQMSQLQAVTQLDQANQQLQSYQQVMTQLQQLGMIRVNADGSITVRRRGGD
jgi:hypothetical protein